MGKEGNFQIPAVQNRIYCFTKTDNDISRFKKIFGVETIPFNILQKLKAQGVAICPSLIPFGVTETSGKTFT